MIKQVYLAHNFAARESLRNNEVPMLRDLGIGTTSSWIYDDSHLYGKNNVASALIDLADIDRADAVVLFIDQYGDKPGRGKFFELGYAVAKGKKCFIIGSYEGCIFYHLPQVIRIQTLTELLNY